MAHVNWTKKLYGRGEGGQRVCGGSGVSMQRAARKTHSAELETMRIWRNPTTVMTANSEMQTRERSHGMWKNWTFPWRSKLLEETPAVLSREALWGVWVFLPLDQWTKATTHQNDCNKSNCVPFIVPGLYRRVRPLHPIPTSPTFSSQDYEFDVSQVDGKSRNQRNGSTSEDLRRNPMDQPTETDNTKNERH